MYWARPKKDIDGLPGNEKGRSIGKLPFFFVLIYCLEPICVSYLAKRKTKERVHGNCFSMALATVCKT